MIGTRSKAALERRVGEQVRLRRLWWDGPEPTAGDELRTRSGRRYLVCEVRGKTIVCRVLPLDAEQLAGRVWHWEWANRTRKRAERMPIPTR